MSLLARDSRRRLRAFCEGRRPAGNTTKAVIGSSAYSVSTSTSAPDAGSSAHIQIDATATPRPSEAQAMTPAAERAWTRGSTGTTSARPFRRAAQVCSPGAALDINVETFSAECGPSNPRNADDHVAVALARGAHGLEPVHHGRSDPEGTRSHLLGLREDKPTTSLSSSGGNPAGRGRPWPIILGRLIFYDVFRLP